ncbi:hypothetical protein JCM14076_27760 [Methylosoma difficile]
MDMLQLFNQRAKPLVYRMYIGRFEYTANLNIMTLNGAFLSYPPKFSPDYVDNVSKIDVFFEGEWLSLACKVIYAAAEDDGIFPFGFGIVFAEEEATQWALAKLSTTLLLNEMGCAVTETSAESVIIKR